jgi:hypothetical protein
MKAWHSTLICNYPFDHVYHFIKVKESNFTVLATRQMYQSQLGYPKFYIDSIYCFGSYADLFFEIVHLLYHFFKKEMAGALPFN